MKTRSPLEICAPAALFALACVLSISSLIIAIAWMTVGVCCLGYRRLDDFPTERIPTGWTIGLRGACLHFWHLAWWPWYMRGELHQLARHARRILLMRRLSGSTRVDEGDAGDDDRKGRH